MSDDVQSLSEKIKSAMDSGALAGLVYARPMSASVKQTTITSPNQSAIVIVTYVSFLNGSGELECDTVFLDSASAAIQIARALNMGQGIYLEMLDQDTLGKMRALMQGGPAS